MTTQPQPEALRQRLLDHAACHESDHWLMAEDEQRQWASDLREAEALMGRLHAECEALRFTRALAQARYENAVKLLTGIHELLYPAPVNTPDGRTLAFRSNDPDPHAILQLLSDRIRAIPAELEAARAAKEQSNG